MKTMKQTLVLLVLLLGLKLALTAAQKPNIIFILTDDQRYDAMGFMGTYPFLETPNIDRIADEGVHFTNSFVTISLCGPSRAAFLTGTYPHVNGVSTNAEGREFNPLKTPTFPMLLRENGYRTAFIGKWHMDHSRAPRQGFDHWVSFSGQGNYNGNDLNIDGKEVRNEGYITDELTQYAIDFIKKNSKEPFCLYLSHKAVHGPFTPADRHKNQYQEGRFPELPSYSDDLSGKPAWQRIRMPAEDDYRIRDNNPRIVKKRIPAGHFNPKVGAKSMGKNYLRAISAVDEGVGRLYEVLESEGMLENTCIIFAGDNGYMLGEHHRGDKRVPYNESMRIPWVMRLPQRIPPGSKVDEMILNVDLAPTLLDLAGVDPPAIMQGRSVLPLFRANKPEWRDSFLFTYWPDLMPNLPRMLSVRTERYVYSTYPDLDDIDELYDLERDPYEMRNLVELPEYAGLLETMQSKLDANKAAWDYREIVPRPRPEPNWPVRNGLLCDLSFSEARAVEVRDAAGIAGKPTIKGGSITRGMNGSALKFDAATEVLIPWEAHISPDKGSYIIETLVRPSRDGVIAAQGNDKRGIMLYIENGRPGFVLVGSKGRRIFVDAKTEHTDKWVYLVAQVRNHENRIRLWVNGELAGDVFMMWPFNGFMKHLGGMTLGHDPGGMIDPREISPLRFTGEMEYFRIHRETELDGILARQKI